MTETTAFKVVRMHKKLVCQVEQSPYDGDAFLCTHFDCE